MVVFAVYSFALNINWKALFVYEKFSANILRP